MPPSRAIRKSRCVRPMRPNPESMMVPSPASVLTAPQRASGDLGQVSPVSVGGGDVGDLLQQGLLESGRFEAQADQLGVIDEEVVGGRLVPRVLHVVDLRTG